mgnify:CR=1 FL=1
MNKRKITVAVTGLNNIDSPGSGIPVIRGIRESSFFDARIIGLAYENLEPGIYMRDLVDKSYLIPYPSEGSDALMNRILEIHAKESIDVVIPNFDAELTAFMKAEFILLFPLSVSLMYAANPTCRLLGRNIRSRFRKAFL